MNRILAIATALAVGVTQAAWAQPVPGGALVAASDLEPVSLDPIFGNAPSIDGNYYNLFYDNLFYLDAESVMQPELATSWTIADDGITIARTMTIYDDLYTAPLVRTRGSQRGNSNELLESPPCDPTIFYNEMMESGRLEDILSPR